MTAGNTLVELDHVYKRFGSRVALRDVCFSLNAGDSVSILGANGAGKTTMLRTLATLARPTRGHVRAFGVDAWSERAQVRARIGVVAHQSYVYPELTCLENLRFVAAMFGLPDARAIALSTLDRVGLSSRGHERADTLSRGLLQRLNLARAIVHSPAVLILDEPDTGLDMPGRDVLSEIIRSQLEFGGSVVLASHAIDLALDLSSRVVVVSQGRIDLDANRAGLSSSDITSLLRQPIVAGS